VPDSLHEDTSIPVVPTPAIAVAAQAPEVQEDPNVIPGAESDLPNFEIKTGVSSSIEEGDAVQDASPSQGFVDAEVQSEIQEREESFNTDSGVAVASIPEALLYTVIS
jgi:hypothetical protein